MPTAVGFKLTYLRIMQATVEANAFSAEHELTCFLLFLENHDGNGWNQLRSDLSSIFLNRKTDTEYLVKATFRTASYVERWRAHYWAKYAVNRTAFYRLQHNFVAAAAAAIAYNEMQEFKLGNFS